MDFRKVVVKGRASPLPSFSEVQEKHHLTTRPSRFFTTFYVPLPNRKRLILPLPVPPALWIWLTTKFGRKRASFSIFAILLGMMWVVFVLTKAAITGERPGWKPVGGKPPTLVFGREDLRRIWEWEVASGHYPSTRPIPDEIRMAVKPINFGIPPLHLQRSFGTSKQQRSTSTVGAGSRRTYMDIQSQPPNTAYPPRVPPGTVADLDVIMDNCDFSENKYVRDCLEVLRLGAGLDANNRLRRGKVDIWKYIFREDPSSTRMPPPKPAQLSMKQQQLLKDGSSNNGLRRKAVLEPPLTNLTIPIPAKPLADLPGPCDPDYPRIFHMFWTGPFTDKPYTAILSFLFTQNIGLHTKTPDPSVCRPEFWMWINPGPAAAVPNPNALGDMFQELADNPWASPFLHPRFKDVVKFKMWNTTEQLDGIPEIKADWRVNVDTLFNSGDAKYKQKDQMMGNKQEAMAAEELAETIEAPDHVKSHILNATEQVQGSEHTSTASASSYPSGSAGGDDLFNRVGSTSESTYDRLSVILSDMARFVLCHRFGGTYLDADTIFLRDWEELWGWRGAFAYRWSRLPDYNTAVLRLNKGSALGTFLLRTILRNGLDFHPMSIAIYMKESFLQPLLLRLPDALFDPAWLALEGYQRERPQWPGFTNFLHFFRPPVTESAAPQMLGFDGFFKGAYSYHYHNGWWEHFDAARDFPDLGPRFKEGERKARTKLRDEAAKSSREAQASSSSWSGSSKHRATHHTRPLTEKQLQALEDEEDDVLRDVRDLPWSTVMKRTFEAYIRGERPNMYGEWLEW
ncbi:hypothetical protein FRB94_012019 [Tulasnella sp. JGI-2019a]|nr:hypothetical protein FRB93_006096 [Tulasnella sp. JGI-2019a]KAG8992093.1 hypothetical protein FRB94_012019 [Tulasnella sp. JGI-2019a]KAG9022331.1 hypothetical protein FRB95_000344 [Tulasnella sp. JGI-2019a]